MTVAIITKYLGYTNTKPSRIKAATMSNIVGGAAAPCVTIPYDHGQSSDQNHAKAAAALAERLKWTGQWVKGDGATGNVYVNVGTRAVDLSDVLAFAFLIEKEA